MAGLEGHTVDLLARAKCVPHCQSRCKRVQARKERSEPGFLCVLVRTGHADLAAACGRERQPLTLPLP